MTRDRLSRRQILLAAGAVLVSSPAIRRPAVAQGLPARPAIALPRDIEQGDATTITRVRTARPVVALTFDDGPHASLTPRLLDILALRGVRATFYVIGSRVPVHLSVMRRIAEEGHEIGNHSWSHPKLSDLGDAAILSELDRTSAAIMDAVGRVPVTMRPPYGSLTGAQRRMVQASRNLPTVLWSVDPEDWRNPGAQAVTERIVGGSHPGGVILTHDIRAGTIEAMPATLDRLLARGYEFVTLSELIGWPRWDGRAISLASSAG